MSFLLKLSLRIKEWIRGTKGTVVVVNQDGVPHILYPETEKHIELDTFLILIIWVSKCLNVSPVLFDENMKNKGELSLGT